jgi:hypothetical protein
VGYCLLSAPAFGGDRLEQGPFRYDPHIDPNRGFHRKLGWYIARQVAVHAGAVNAATVTEGAKNRRSEISGGGSRTDGPMAGCAPNQVIVEDLCGAANGFVLVSKAGGHHGVARRRRGREDPGDTRVLMQLDTRNGLSLRQYPGPQVLLNGHGQMQAGVGDDGHAIFAGS